MEKLHRRSDGYSETSSGDFAVVPQRKSAVVERTDGIYNSFSFKPSFNADTITVEWPIENSIAVFPGDVSTLMVRLGYARNLTKEEVEQYNSSADFEDANAPADESKQEEQPKQEEPPADEPKEPAVPADEKPADVQAEEEKKKPGRPKKEVVIPGLTS
nr:MAG TPA: hypothetical protein [Caudoviricetes sp.]